MDKEKEMLRQDLSKQEKPEEIEKFIEDAELMGGHEDIIELAKAKLEAVDKKVEQVNTPIPLIEQTKIYEKGGSPEVVQEKVTEVDASLNENAEKINEVKTEATEKVEEVKIQNQEIPIAVESIPIVSSEEKITDPSLIEADNFQEFKKTLSPELFPKKVQQFQEFMKQKYGNLQEGSEEFKNKWKEVATAVEYQGNTENPYIKQYKPDISLGEYRQNREELHAKMAAFNTIEEVKKKAIDDSAEQEKWNFQTIDDMQKDEKYKNQSIEKFKKEGFSSNMISNAGKLQMAFEKGLISANDIAQGLANKGTNSEIASQLKKLPSEIVDKIKNETVTTPDGRKLPIKQYIDSSFNNERTNYLSRLDLRPDTNTNLQYQALNLAEASSLMSLYKAANRPFDDEFKKVWNDKLKSVEEGITKKDYVASSFYKNADLKIAVAVDKRILDNIVLPGLKKDLKIPNYTYDAAKTIEKMVKDNLLTREQADEMYKEALVLSQ